MADHVHMIGDIGGTNARFALLDDTGSGFTHLVTMKCVDFDTPELAIAHFLDSVGAPEPAVICLAAAGPVVDGRVRLTNLPWHLDTRSLRDRFGHAECWILNDFEAVAYGLPAIPLSDKQQLGPVPETELRGDYCICAVGPGTGLGAAGLICRNGITQALVTEAGHVGFAPETSLQIELLKVLRRKFERVSDERVVSGMGIVNLYQAMGEVTGEVPGEVPGKMSGEVPGKVPGGMSSEVSGEIPNETPGGAATSITAAAVFEAAAAGDTLATRSIDLFFELLGQVAGNLVLSVGAFDGAYIVGGVAQRHADLLVQSRFRAGFENKGRHRGLLERVPAHLIVHPEPGLAGAAVFARRLVGEPS